ncbi:MAG: DUF4097 family beta strand repeat protein [Butyrivibrio sp.]|nr:DUF4097 family beta strand repeat protein [Butyrivibrio sp.]
MRIEKKIAIIIAAIMVIGGLSMAISAVLSVGGNFRNMFGTVEYQEQTKEITEAFDDIDIDVKDQDLYIKKSTDKRAYFICSESKNIKYNVSVSGKTLKIEEKSENKLWHFSFGDMDSHPAQLYLPEDKYNNLKAHVGSGDMYLQESFELGNVDLKVGSGNIYLDKVIADAVNLKTGSGQIWFTGSQTVSTSIHSGSGDLTAQDIACKKGFSVDTGSGKLFLSNVTSTESFYAKASSGDIFLESCDSIKMELRSGSGDITGSIKTAKTFDAHAGSGDVRVPTDGNGGNCLIKTGSGDIEITVEN